MTKLKNIEIIFENTETIIVDADDINMIYMDHISSDFNYINDKIEPAVIEVKRCDNFAMVLLSSANKKHSAFNLDKREFETTVFERIMSCKDIVAIELHGENDEAETYYMPWQDEDECDIFNANQLTEIFDDNCLSIKILEGL